MPSHRPASLHDSAFTLVEILVVLVITAVLMAIGFLSISGARATGRVSSAISVAHAYSDAADRFARDHRGRYPDAPGSDDWPGPGRDLAAKGPNAPVLSTKRTYLERIPEPVQDGSIVFNPGASETGISYAPITGGSGFEFTVHVPGRNDCVVRGGSTAGATSTRACSNR